MTIKSLDWLNNFYTVCLNNVVFFEYLDSDGEINYFGGTLNKNAIYLYTDKVFKNQDLDLVEEDGFYLFDLFHFYWRSIPLSSINKDSIVTSNFSSDNLFWKGIYNDSYFKRRKDVLNLLSDYVLELVLENEDGSLNLMTCSKKFDLDVDVYENPYLNTELNKSKCSSCYPVTVYDYNLLDKGEFIFERLVKYRIKGSKEFIPFYPNEGFYETIIKSKIYNIKKLSSLDIAIADGLIENPKKFYLNEIKDTLDEKIVRMVFLNSDSNLFVVYGTRNIDVIERYVDEISFNEFNKGSKKLSVYDIKRKMFIDLDFNKICDYDFLNKVGSWIEFEIEDINWFLILYKGFSILTFYKIGSKEAISLGRSIDLLTYLKPESLFEKNDSIAEKITDSIEKITLDKPFEITNINFSDKINGFGDSNIINGEEAFTVDINNTNLDDVDSAKTVLNEADSAKTDLNEADSVKTDLNEADSVKTNLTEVDIAKTVLNEADSAKIGLKEFDKDLNEHTKVIKKEKRLNKVDIKQVNSDLKRMEKLKNALLNESDNLFSLNLDYMYILDKMDNTVVLFKCKNSDKKILVSPDYIIDNNNKIIYKRSQWYRTAKDFDELISNNSDVLGFNKKQNNFLVKIISYCWDLRKK